VYRNEEVIKGRGHRWEEILQLKPNVVITREIGRPAYYAFRAGGVKIFLAEGATARETLEKWRRGELREFPPELVHEPRHGHHRANRRSSRHIDYAGDRLHSSGNNLRKETELVF
jgi:predicted Fe-Mo cluster-binding NifX family protein